MDIKHLSSSCFWNFENNNKYSYSRIHCNLDGTYLTIIFNALIFNTNRMHYIIMFPFTDYVINISKVLLIFYYRVHIDICTKHNAM